MALGGGTFTSTNKLLPGSYIKFVSAGDTVSVVGERGAVAIVLPLDWNINNDVIEVTAEDFTTKCLSIFGYNYDSDKMKGMRDLFKNAKKVFIYNANAGGAKATDGTYATAKYSGVVGNAIQIVIEANPNVENGFDFKTFVATKIGDGEYDGYQLVDMQTVTKADDLVPNDFVDWKSFTMPSQTTTVTLTGGSNGTTASSHQEALNAFQHYSFNTLCAYTTTLVSEYLAYVETMRNSYGKNFRLVVYNQSNVDTEVNEAVINVCTPAKTSADDSSITNTEAHALLYWVAGADAGIALNKSLTNKKYDGEFAPKITSNETQAVLETYLADGKFVFHKVGADIRVLDDINSFVVSTADKAKDIFGVCQTIRILDQAATDNATLFNTKYLGNVPNDVMGRTAYWNELVTYYKTLASMGAIEDVDPNNDIVVSAVPDNKRAVKVDVVLTPINTMAQVYMTVFVQ
jgi:hypothetical protein